MAGLVLFLTVAGGFAVSALVLAATGLPWLAGAAGALMGAIILCDLLGG